MNSVDTLQKEGINVAVTPTISQMNLHEILNITKYFTGRGVPVWYCLYSFDLSTDVNQLFRIGKANDEFMITDKQAMVQLMDDLKALKKTNKRVLMTSRLLKALRSYYSDDKRTWNCQALRNFFVIDHTGRIAGCHVHNFASSIFDLPKIWKSGKFDELRKTYRKCSQCTYLCYIFYSLHGSPYGNLVLAKDQWRNSQFLLKKDNAKPLSTAKPQ
jgi:MoaA/NifB/PqqE/SkfB family radical SAM enzyme